VAEQAKIAAKLFLKIAAFLVLFFFPTGKVNGSLMKCPANFSYSKSEKNERFS